MKWGKRAESLLKNIIVENFPNLGKELDIKVHEASRSYYINAQRLSLRHIIMTLSKVNDEFERQPGRTRK